MFEQATFILSLYPLKTSFRFDLSTNNTATQDIGMYWFEFLKVLIFSSL